MPTVEYPDQIPCLTLRLQAASQHGLLTLHARGIHDSVLIQRTINKTFVNLV